MNYDRLSRILFVDIWAAASHKVTENHTEYVTALHWHWLLESISPQANPSGFSEQALVVDSLLTPCKSSDRLLCLCAKWDFPRLMWVDVLIETQTPGNVVNFEKQIEGTIWRSSGCDDSQIGAFVQWSQVIGPSSRKVDRFMPPPQITSSVIVTVLCIY